MMVKKKPAYVQRMLDKTKAKHGKAKAKRGKTLVVESETLAEPNPNITTGKPDEADLKNHNVRFKDRLAYWHKSIAQITGAMSMCYQGTGIKRHVLAEWERVLTMIAADIRRIGKLP